MKKKKFTVRIKHHGKRGYLLLDETVEAQSISQAAVLAEQLCSSYQPAFEDSLFVESITTEEG